MTDAQLVLAFGALAVAALAFALFAWRTSRVQARRLATFLPDAGPDGARDLARVLESLATRITRLEEGIARLAETDAELAERLAGRLSKPGVVRFNAFSDMGSDLSFSLAFLDDHGDGVVISAIQSREECRVYAKPIRAGTSAHTLSPEERNAILQAGMQGNREN